MDKIKKKALFSLVLLIPAPSLGVVMAMVLFPETILGAMVFWFSKLWLFSLPVVWHKLIDKEKLSLSTPKRGGFLIGLSSGLVISLVISLVYYFWGKFLIDKTLVIQKMSEIGLRRIDLYIACAFYWILFNSVLEEYVWRWFVVKQSEVLFKSGTAIFFSAACFTLHHILAMGVYFGLSTVLICSLSIFFGGTIWSFMYLKYRSIWPGYLSHAIVDVCIFMIGGLIIFS